MSNESKNKAVARAALLKRGKTAQTQISNPSLPGSGSDKSAVNALLIDARFSSLNDELTKQGLTLTDYLSDKGLLSVQSERKVKAPSGAEYIAALTSLSYEELRSRCVIDADNVRGAYEHTEEALASLIDEIGNGYQLLPIIAYIAADGKLHIVDGSRRYHAALFGNVGLMVEIYSSKPAQADIQWMVGASDNKEKFSFFDKGRLYSNIMQTRGWTQAELHRNRGYSEADVSRCVKLFTLASDDFHSVLDIKNCKLAQVEVINKYLAVVLKANRYNELKSTINKEDYGYNDEVIKTLEYFARKLLNPQAKPKKAPVKPIPVYEDPATKRAVTFTKRSKAKSQIELNNLTDEQETKIKALIADYLVSSVTEG